MNDVPSIQIIKDLVTTQDAERLLEWARGINAVIPGFVIPITKLDDHFRINTDESMDFAVCLIDLSESTLNDLNKGKEGEFACGEIGPDLESVLDSGVLMMGATWACHEQFIENMVWPDSCSDGSVPHQIEMRFFRDGHATLVLLGNTSSGTLIWKKEDIEFSGTWQEVYQRLADMHRGGYPLAGVPEFKSLDA